MHKTEFTLGFHKARSTISGKVAKRVLFFETRDLNLWLIEFGFESSLI